MSNEEVIQICRERNEIDFLFDICKIVAETDSIGESYSYCNKYTKEMFNDANRHIDGYYNDIDQYLSWAGIPIYKRYLKQIKVI